MKRYEQYGRNPSWIVKWYRKYGRNASWNVKKYGKYGRFLLVIITHKETSSPPPASLLLLLPHAVLILLLRRRRFPPPPPSMPPTSFPIRVAYGHVTSGDVTPVTWLPIAPHLLPTNAALYPPLYYWHVSLITFACTSCFTRSTWRIRFTSWTPSYYLV